MAQSPSLEPWILDSGASDHITGNKSLFSTLSYMDRLPSITLADGTQSKAIGIGQVNHLPSLSLDSVLYVPTCPFNLISVRQLIRKLPYSVLFVNKSGLVGQGHEFGGFFRLASPTICCIAETASIIHQRLGHLNLQKLHRMIPSLAKVQSILCESCQLGKHVEAHIPIE
jgi:hypothetical protein